MVNLPLKKAFESKENRKENQNNSNAMNLEEIYLSEPSYSGSNDIHNIDFIPPKINEKKGKKKDTEVVKDVDFEKYGTKHLETNYDDRRKVGKKRRAIETRITPKEKRITLSVGELQKKNEKSQKANDAQKKTTEYFEKEHVKKKLQNLKK